MEVGNETIWLSRYLRKYKIYNFLTYAFGKIFFVGKFEIFLLLLVNVMLKYTQNYYYDKPAVSPSQFSVLQ